MILSIPSSSRFITLIFIFLCFSAHVNAEESEETSADFLDFLAEMEESTGDGFTAWLDDESNDQLDKSSTISTGSNQ